MDSHEYAVILRKQAEYLDSKPKFDMPNYTPEVETLWYMHDKDGFVSAVRAVGAGKKDIGTEYVDFQPIDAPISLRVERSVVCKLVKPAEYDCEPFLSHEELNQLDMPKPMQEEVENRQEIPF